MYNIRLQLQDIEVEQLDVLIEAVDLFKSLVEEMGGDWVCDQLIREEGPVPDDVFVRLMVMSANEDPEELEALLSAVAAAARMRVTDKPLPCPYCGSSDILIAGYGDTWWGRCNSCCANTVLKSTEQEALAAWNRRSI